MKFIAVKEAPEGILRIKLSETKISEWVVTDGVDELYIGIGKKKEIDRRKYLRLLRRIIIEAKARKVVQIVLSIEDITFKKLKISPKELGELLAANLEIANYTFSEYKSDKEEGKEIENVYLLGASASIMAGVEIGQIVAAEVNAARSLANTPGGDMTPEKLGKAAEKAAEGTKVRVSVLGLSEMRKLKMGALLGVGKGSTASPRFIVMEYNGGRKKDKPIVLVGKGITFDTGGINLKPTGGLDDMHLDMSGAAMVLHAAIAAAKLKLKKNIIVLIPSAENMVSGESYRPGDILTSMSGKTIEIGNTDAEGRVVMADALTYAERYEPKLVVDVATLTGAALVALGTRASAIFSKNDKLLNRIQGLSEDVGEYVWPLPIWDEYAEDYKPQFADVSNVQKIRWGGAIAGAKFLENFTEKYPWVHIDMAPRMTSIEGDYLAKGSTGEPVRLLVKILQRM